MTAVSSTTAATSAAAATTKPAEPSIGDRFLKLLVTQLKNQDPLSPMDNAQLTSQLAQISTVTGITQLNDTMTSLSASLGSNQYLQAANLVGHNVLVPGNKLQLAGGAATGGINMSAAADSVVVSVSDASGRVVRKIDMGAQEAGPQKLSWDGKTDSGAAAAPGLYSFTVAATQGGTAVTADALMSGHVDGVVVGTGGTTQVQLGQLGRADLSSIIQIN